MSKVLQLQMWLHLWQRLIQLFKSGTRKLQNIQPTTNYECLISGIFLILYLENSCGDKDLLFCSVHLLNHKFLFPNAPRDPICTFAVLEDTQKEFQKQ